MSNISKCLKLMPVMCILCLCLGLTGCSGSGTQYADPDVLPIKVYRVIASHDSHTAPSFNDGCMMTDAEITQVIVRFETSVPILFGASTTMSWDGVVYPMTDPAISDRSNATYADLLLRIATTGSIYSDPAFVNIYFTGNYYTPPDDPFVYQLWGATNDPHSVFGTGLLNTGVIMINDGAGPGGGSVDVPAILGRATLEHEMAHYLGRFNHNTVTQTNQTATANRTYGSGITTRTFLANGGEHINDPTTLHILLSGDHIPASGLPIVLPGIDFGVYLSANRGAERGEVSKKMSVSGGYNNWRR